MDYESFLRFVSIFFYLGPILPIFIIRKPGAYNRIGVKRVVKLLNLATYLLFIGIGLRAIIVLVQGNTFTGALVTAVVYSLYAIFAAIYYWLKVREAQGLGF